MVRDTSIIAYKDHEADGARTQRLKVFEAISANPGSTDKELSIITGININAVTGRRNELMKENLIESAGKRACSVTGRLAYTWVVCREPVGVVDCGRIPVSFPSRHGGHCVSCGRDIPVKQLCPRCSFCDFLFSRGFC